jgi:hypothetical protein
MSRPIRTIALTAAGAAIATAVMVGGAVTAHSDAPPPLADTLGVLGHAAVPADRLPGAVPLALHGDGGLIAASARSLGANAGVAYWTAIDLRGRVCIVAVSSADGYTASSCAVSTSFAEGGVSLRVDDAVHGKSWQAVLVPDASLPAKLAAGWDRVSSNLVVTSLSGASDSGAAALTLRPPGSAPVELTVIPGDG